MATTLATTRATRAVSRLHVIAITHRKDAVYPATIVGIPPMEDFYIGGAALLSHRMGEGLGVRVQDEPPKIVDIALPQKASSTTSSS